MKSNYKIGEHIVDFVCIYQIIDISQDDSGDNLIHYQPVRGTDKIFTNTIPEKNLNKAGLRRPFSSKEINLVFKNTKKLPEDYVFDPRQIKEDIYTNDPTKLVEYLKYFLNKQEVLIRVEQDLKDEILNHLCLEISFIKNQSISSVKKTIETTLLDK